MIDLNKETTVTLDETRKGIKPGHSGKQTHISTIIRWIKIGARGPNGQRVRLEAVRLGGRWLTSREALQRFAERLTPDLDRLETPEPRTPSRRERAAASAARDLENLDI